MCDALDFPAVGQERLEPADARIRDPGQYVLQIDHGINAVPVAGGCYTGRDGIRWPATATRGTRTVSSPCVGGPREAPSWRSGDAILAVQVRVEPGFKGNGGDRETGASVGISRASGPCAG